MTFIRFVDVKSRDSFAATSWLAIACIHTLELEDKLRTYITRLQTTIEKNYCFVILAMSKHNKVYFQIGDTFSTVQQLENKVKKYSEEGFVLSKHNTKKVDDCMIYSSLNLQCHRFGNYVTRGSGKRKATSEKCECPVVLKIGRTRDKKKLIILEGSVFEHNEECVAKSKSKKLSIFDYKSIVVLYKIIIIVITRQNAECLAL